MLLRSAFFLCIPLLVPSKPLYRFDNRESAPSSASPTSTVGQILTPMVNSVKHYEEGPEAALIQPKETKKAIDEEASEKQLPTVMLEQNLKLETVSGSLEEIGKDQGRPKCETSEVDPEEDDPPEETGKVPMLKPRFTLVPVPCTEKELRIPLFKEDKSDEEKTLDQPNVVEISTMQIDAHMSPPPPNKSSFAEKHIDVTLRELDQPVAPGANDDADEEEDAGVSLIDIHISPSLDDPDLEEDLMGPFEPECDKVTPKPKKPTEASKTGDIESLEIAEFLDSLYEEQFFRITAYLLSLFADVLEDEPSTWQKIIAGVQCVLRDCREALPFRPSDRPMIKEGGFIIRRARESLCTCYIPGLTDN